MNICHDSRKRQSRTFGMECTQSTMRSIFHDQNRDIIGPNTEVQQRHDVGMLQAHRTSLIDKCLQFSRICEACVKHLHRRQSVIAYMLSQIYLTTAAPTEPAKQAVLSKMLSK